MAERTPVNDGSLWPKNEIQFPRLLSEARAVLEPGQIKDIAESMDLSVAEVNSLFRRAESEWEHLKREHAGA